MPHSALFSFGLMGFLIVLALLNCHTNETPDVRTILLQARQIAALMEDEHDQGLILARIAARQVEAREEKEAFQTVASIKHMTWKDKAIAGIAVAKAEIGDVKGGVHNTDSIQNQLYRALALRDIAVIRAEAGDVNGAFQVATSIKDEFMRESALGYIVKARAKAGDLKGAREIAATIRLDHNYDSSGEWPDESPPIIIAMASIAEAQAKAGDVEGAKRTAAALTNKVDRDYLLKVITSVREEAQIKDAPKNEGAEAERMKRIFEAAATLKGEESEIADSLIMVAEWQARAGDVQGAVKLCDRLRSPHFKSQALVAVADGMLASAKSASTAQVDR